MLEISIEMAEISMELDWLIGQSNSSRIISAR